MPAKFTVYLDRAKKYRFNLKAANGEIIASGESYPDRKSALKGIASIQKNAAAAKIIDETAPAEAPKSRDVNQPLPPKKQGAASQRACKKI
jgi:uncharacterized protein YegP (UPF0339 family)